MVIERSAGKSLTDYLLILRRYWVLIVVAVIAAAVAGFGLFGAHQPQYTSQARVYVAASVARPSINDLAQANVLAQSTVLSYAQVATSPLVLTPVIAKLRLSDSVDDLAGRMSVAVVPNTVVMTIDVNDGSPAQAASIANGIASQLAAVTPQLGGDTASGAQTATVTVSLLQPATANPNPVGAGVTTYVGVAVLASFVLLVLLIAFIETVRGARSRIGLERA